MPKPHIILASASQRRIELFGKLGIKFKAVASDFAENMSLPMPPKRLAVFLARGKAEAVLKKYPKSIIVGADTIVVLGKKVLGKPKDKKDAQKMLKLLSGKRHSVITGFAIIGGAGRRLISGAVETKVYFCKVSAREIENYVRSSEPMDKAGAYAIQGRGGLFIDRIDGDYYNVVGFPLLRIADSLRKFGVRID